MGAATLAAEFRSLSRQPPVDPDVQATLSDFLTYTEHFPSHLTRALSLIEDQRTRVERSIRSIHEDALVWSELPNLKDGRPDPATLRRNISYALQEAERASRMALEEAIRMDESCAREAKRLDLVVAKLMAQPMPPSRDPTPEQQALTSPNLKRERRTSMRGDDARPEKPGRRLDDRAATKLRGRKIMVPGEVLPPPDPNAVVETESDWTSPRDSPPIDGSPFADREMKTATPRPRSRTPKLPKLDKEKRQQQKVRIVRAAGQPGTNAHSAVAGISTSNALLALTAPPEGAPKGSKWLPWMALTEWEMAKLRKRMKKNAIWVPSQTMVRRELKNLGRGVAGREAAREEAELTGGVFVDEQSAPDPTKTVLDGEVPAQVPAVLDDRLYEGGAADDQDQELINRGMRLNEAKKLKRQRLLEEQALQAQFAREQGLDSIAGDFKAAPGPVDGRKRKRDLTPTADSFGGPAATDTADSTTRAAPKRLKISAPAGAGSSTSRIPLGPPGVSSPRGSGARLRTTTPPATDRKTSLLLKSNKAVSEEPPNRRASLRRGSNASLPNSSALTSPGGTASKPSTSGGRRTRRPAPGFLRSSDADSAKVGVSKRKAAPRKKTGAGVAPRPSMSDAATIEAAPEEEIDPDEPRYCLCGDVSWGTMIACDNDDCDKEWFHLACVGLAELPPRRTKWYCPDCRKKLKLGTGNNGLVGRTTSVGLR